jgi:hypothetical protein
MLIPQHSRPHFLPFAGCPQLPLELSFLFLKTNSIHSRVSKIAEVQAGGGNSGVKENLHRKVKVCLFTVARK